jgi:prolyl oligopeptidase
MKGQTPMLRSAFRATMSFSMLLALALPAVAAEEGVAPEKPPVTRKDPVVDTYGGVTVTDPYRWLEDQSAPDTRSWIDSQNRYSDGLLRALPGREGIRKRLGELLKVDSTTAPTEANGRYFFFKRLADQDLAILYVRRGEKGKDEVLVDPHPLSSDHRTSINLIDIVTNGSLVAYGVQVGGEDENTVRFRDVDTGKDLPDVLPRARYSGVSITPDRKAVYFARVEKEGPRVWRHAFGTDAAEDKKIFGDGYGPEKYIGVTLSDDGRWLLATVSHGSAAVKTEVYAQDLAGAGPLAPIVNDLDARFSPRLANDRLYMETNWKAANGRILAVDLKNPARDRWKEVVPARDAAIDGYSAVGGKIFVRYLENVLAKIRIFDAEGKPQGEMAFPEIGNLSGIHGRWDSPEAFFTFVSFVTPPTIYRYDAARGTRSVWARENVPIASANFDVKQVWYTSKDGTRVPMFLVHKKGLKRDGSHPALLTGYGGFNLASSPGFSARAAVWVEKGGVYALANLRGGNEFGEDWHHAGMLAKKQNVFDDFIAAAEYLVSEKYTSPGRLAISGGSNGGLLVGAALTQRPDLFAAVVCSYPLLDMLRYQKFLVAGYWVPEYGSAENPEQFPFLYAYSPYQHVKAGTQYPAVLFVTGDSDTRVAPLHARKMTALLQESTGSDRPVILHYDTKAGHSRGSTPIPKQIDDLTDELAFLFAETSPAIAVPMRKAS